MEREQIDERVARAHELHKKGYNCAQAVVCSCADLVGVDEALAFKMVEGFGRGMGDYSQTCGAVSGGVAAIGCASSDGPHNPRTKGATYKLAKQLVERFREQNGSTLCAELRGLAGGPMLRTCPGCVEDGIRMTIDVLQEAGIVE